MLDIDSEFAEVRKQFISIYDLVNEIKIKSNQNDISKVCRWILKRINDSGEVFPFLYRLNDNYIFEFVFINSYGNDDDLEYFVGELNDIITDDRTLSREEYENFNIKLRGNIYETGFKREEIEKVFPEISAEKKKRCDDVKVTYSTTENSDFSVSEAENTNHIRELGDSYENSSEGLEALKEILYQFWSTFDPNDVNTAPTKKEIINYLTEKGISKNMAESIDMILRPEVVKKRGIPTNKGW
ncbi:hypothetical protein [Xenorhabdus koppenhoeferi]|uniref:hypothetical protein n=1 Tax=Xenorhabdus koppenhoeferi TaxID=351659 RepID=UPI002B40ECD7|nr:hypothetical protein [Xenorhabdus sp. Vera]